jgi:hypothetical protein
MAIWLFGYLAIWLFGYLAIWLFGCSSASPRSPREKRLLVFSLVPASLDWGSLRPLCERFCLSTAIFRINHGFGQPPPYVTHKKMNRKNPLNLAIPASFLSTSQVPFSVLPFTQPIKESPIFSGGSHAASQ